MYRDTYAKIDLKSIYKNVANTIDHIGSKTMLMAVVKADAYGHGSVEVAKTAIKAGAKWLAVALAEEGELLRKNGITAPVLILGISNKAQTELAIKNGLSICAASLEELEIIAKTAQKLSKKANIHIKIDSGMGRIGFRDKEDFIKAISLFNSDESIFFEGIFTHFAKADYYDKSFTNEQRTAFDSFVALAKEKGFTPLVHCANSAAIIDISDSYLDIVRLGISLYGYYPSDEVIKSNIKYYPAMTVKTKIVFLKNIDKGDGVGYGRTFIANGKTKIATLPIGYGDGYNRLLSNKGKVIVICGKRSYYANIVGRICMDQTMIDVTNIPDVKIGDDVIILGSSMGKKFDADDMAEICGTISYEILLDFNYRVPKAYVGAENG